MPLVFGEGGGEGDAAVEFIGDLANGGGEPAAAHVLGDQAQALLDGQAGLGEMGELLVEGDEIIAGERLGGGDRAGRRKLQHAQAHGGEARGGIFGGGGVNGA